MSVDDSPPRASSNPPKRFTFPLSLLHTAADEEDLKELIVMWALDAYSKALKKKFEDLTATWQPRFSTGRFSHAERLAGAEIEELAASQELTLPNNWRSDGALVLDEGAYIFHVFLALAALRLRVFWGNDNTYKETRWNEIQNRVDDYVARIKEDPHHDGSARVSVSRDWLWTMVRSWRSQRAKEMLAAGNRPGMDLRCFVVYCAIFSCIGKSRFGRVTLKTIAHRIHGVTRADDLRTYGVLGHDLSTKQLRTTVDKLARYGFFWCVTVNRKWRYFGRKGYWTSAADFQAEVVKKAAHERNKRASYQARGQQQITLPEPEASVTAPSTQPQKKATEDFAQKSETSISADSNAPEKGDIEGDIKGDIKGDIEGDINKQQQVQGSSISSSEKESWDHSVGGSRSEEGEEEIDFNKLDRFELQALLDRQREEHERQAANES